MCIKSEWEELCIYSVLHAGDASTSLTERALELTAWVHPPHPTSQASAIVRPPIFRTCRHAAAADTGRAGGVVKGSAANDLCGCGAR